METSEFFRQARPADWDAVAALLRELDLPQDGAREHLEHFTVAIDPEGAVAGVAGLERYGETALLRSVAIRERRRGLGTRLVEYVLADARRTGVRTIVLLTTTAPDFFARLGFERIAREAAPAAVRSSVEFRSACPASAVVMHRSLG